MRLYTVEKEGKELPAVSFDGGENAYLLCDLGYDYADMNALICDCTGEKLEALKEEDLPFLAQSAYDDACRPGNPKDCDVESLTALFRKLM